MKEVSEKESIFHLVNEKCIVLVTVFDHDLNRPTGMSCQWIMPLDEVQLANVIGGQSYTGDLIEKDKHYVLNIVSVEYCKDVCILYFG